MNLKSKIATVATASFLALSIVTGTVAQEAKPTVTQEITAGQFTYSLSNGTMNPISFDYARTEAGKTDGFVTLTVTDNRGTYQGWSVSIKADDFVYTSGNANQNSKMNIPASNFKIKTANAAQPVGNSNASNVNPNGGGSPLASGVKVLEAQPNAGSGSYTQKLDVELTVPPKAPAGTYVSTLTLSTTAAPGGTT